MQAAYPGARDRMIAVLNGYDEDPVPRSRHEECFVIAYAGSIYLDRDPRSLFQATARVVKEWGLTPRQLRIEFMGDDRSFDGTPLEHVARETGIGDFVRAHPARPREEARQFLARAALLVSLPLVWLSGATDTSIPAKIFEYVRFDAWLLALANAGSATDLLLRGTGADVVAPHDVAAIAFALRARYAAYASGVRPQRPSLPERLSRRSQARRLFDEIEGACLEAASGTSAASGKPLRAKARL
jgi:3',5'-cyclic AMP phosphodiesterase CpdA